MARHTRTGIRRYEHRAEWWREQLATAASPAEQWELAKRWLHSLARQADDHPAARDWAHPGSENAR
jgi:hypothetical protein